jgi:membrane protease YdiL (CAAX protease family)
LHYGGPRNRLQLFATLLTILTAAYAKYINLEGVITLIVFGSICWVYFQTEIKKRWIRTLLFFIISLISVAFVIHWVPGMSNPMIFETPIQVSPSSRPFLMYISVNKVLIALLLYIPSPLYDRQKKMDLTAYKETVKTLGLCILTIMPIAILSKFVKIELKLSKYMMVWGIINFSFVSFAEEVIFRGVIQDILHKVGTQYALPSAIALIGASIMFGLTHFKGGITYISLATICGMFYGYAYLKTNRVISAMLVHFGLNLFHSIVCTYPSTAPLCK